MAGGETTTIGSLLDRDLRRPIEEIIKVNQADEETVYTELTEYVVTDSIREDYAELLKAIDDARTEPSEAVGVWISGFFGSGKSSFAKNLGYVLANRDVLGHHAADLFKHRAEDQRISHTVDVLNNSMPTEVIMFDVSVDQAVQTQNEKIAEIMYRVLLRELGYAQDFNIAELEIELEFEGKLDRFEQIYREQYTGEWRRDRKGSQKYSRASAVMHVLDPATYPEPNTWADTQRGREALVTIATLVDRTFELMQRRRPGKAAFFIIDEVGQYVARSAEKLEDLRAVVEQYGKESKNRLKTRQAIAPVWVIVTGQEKLEEVVAAIDSRRVELAKLQDRFKPRIDLSPADIRQVATRRVLRKTKDAGAILGTLFDAHEGKLKAATALERSQRAQELDRNDFIQYYPYLPHFVDLSIDIMSGIRLQPGAPKHLGGSNRTIIKQAYEMLVHPRTHLADEPVGRLVSLDLLYDLVEGNLSSEKQTDIADIRRRLAGNDERSWPLRVAKALALLEFVRDLPRSPRNIAAVLVQAVGEPSPLADVQRALEDLQAAQFVTETDEGYKLLTREEKNWERDREGLLAPRPRERNEILRAMLEDVLSDPKLTTFPYREVRRFRLSYFVHGHAIGSGAIVITLLPVDTDEPLQAAADEAHRESVLPAHANDLYWLFQLTPEIDRQIAELHASQQMAQRYDMLRSQGKISNEEAALLANEKQRRNRIHDRLRDLVAQALATGQGYFRGVERDASDLGRSFPDIVRSFVDYALPFLFPKLEIGAYKLSMQDALDVLRAADLAAVPSVLTEGEGRVGLVTIEGGKPVINTNAAPAQEVLGFLREQQRYGNKVTGQDLERHFAGFGYGWDEPVVPLVLAALLRAGAIEVTYQGQRFRNALDPRARTPFEKKPAFRTASFAPRESIGLRALASAARNYEALTGEEVDVEEGAIAEALKAWADKEREGVLPVGAVASANQLPVADFLAEYRTTLEGILAAPSDDCVRLLSGGEGENLAEQRDDVRKIRGALTDAGLQSIRHARTAVSDMAPALAARGALDGLAESVSGLESLLSASDFYESMAEINSLASAIETSYRSLYRKMHDRRHQEFTRAIDAIQGRPEWTIVSENVRQGTFTPDILHSILGPLTFHLCEDQDESRDFLVADGTACAKCRLSLTAIERDLASLPTLRADALARLQELVAGPDGPSRVERVPVLRYFPDPLDSSEAVTAAVERLRDDLLALIDEGARIIAE